MLTTSPHTYDLPAQGEARILEAPPDLADRYLALSERRREVEDALAYVRSELELLAAGALDESMPRGRFPARGGFVSARLRPTCFFDRAPVARELQRMGRLSDVAVVHGPALARFLASEPVVAARLGGLVRRRHGVVLVAGRA